MSLKSVHKLDGYNMFFFKSGSHNDPKKQVKNKKKWEVGVCNTGLKFECFSQTLKKKNPGLFFLLKTSIVH